MTESASHRAPARSPIPVHVTRRSSDTMRMPRRPEVRCDANRSKNGRLADIAPRIFERVDRPRGARDVVRANRLSGDSRVLTRISIGRERIPRRYPKKIFATIFCRSRHDFVAVSTACACDRPHRSRLRECVPYMQESPILQGFSASAKNTRRNLGSREIVCEA